MEMLQGAARQQAARELGCTGLSIIPETLPYVSYGDVWVLPVVHTLLYGVVADFLKHTLRSKRSKNATAVAAAAAAGDDEGVAAALVGTVSAAALRTMRGRAADVQPPTDFGRPYRDITKYINSYLMEDWLHFVETASCYIFKDVSPVWGFSRAVGVQGWQGTCNRCVRCLCATPLLLGSSQLTCTPLTAETAGPAAENRRSNICRQPELRRLTHALPGVRLPLLQVLPPDVKELWELLRSAVLHHCRPQAGAGFSAAARQRAAANMLRFAALMEERGYPAYMFTWNLHWAVCRLPQQELARGSRGRCRVVD